MFGLIFLGYIKVLVLILKSAWFQWWLRFCARLTFWWLVFYFTCYLFWGDILSMVGLYIVLRWFWRRRHPEAW